MTKFAASLICADMLNLGDELGKLERGGVDVIHYDVIDGNWANGFGLSEKLLHRVTACSDLPIEVHLMVTDPEELIDVFAIAGVQRIIVHYEQCVHLHRTISRVKEKGIEIGVALNPATAPSVLSYVLDDLSMITLMSINPGEIGASFLPLVLRKAEVVRSLLDECKEPLSVEIEIDGSIDGSNWKPVIDAGADVLVLGSTSVFASQDSLEVAITRLRKEVDSYTRSSTAHG